MAIGRHELQGKQNLYEHTWRAPLVVQDSGIKPGSRARGNVCLLGVLAPVSQLNVVPRRPNNQRNRVFKTPTS
jgi:hypothetical protein